MSDGISRITRRGFVRGAAAAGLAAPWLLSGRGFGEETAPSERITLGFIGMGKMNQHHLNWFLGNRDTQVLAVCDVDTTRREHAQKTVEERYGQENKDGAYEGCAAYVDFRELLSRQDIDAVVIATPDHWHAIPVIEACQAGKDVYCEKPLSLSIKEAHAMMQAVRKYDRVLQTGSQQRSDQEFRRACELVRNGRIGKIERVIVDVGGPSRWCDLPEEEMEPGLDWDRWLGAAPVRPYHSVLSPRGVHDHFPNWRNYREYSGGMMTDWGAHHFDIAQWGLGMDESGPVEIIPPEDPNAQKGVRYRYENGVEVIHGDGGGVTFIGTEGQIVVNRGKLESTPESILEEPLSEDDERLPESPGHQRDWVNCIRSRERPICDVEIGARSVTVCHLGNLAYWHHRSLRWDPKNWRFVDDEEANGWLDVERRDPWQLPTL
jgi:predicted dehydrogenase